MLGWIKTNRRLAGHLMVAAICWTLGLLALPPSASAQDIVATVNGAPITNFDVTEREKLLRAMHQPNTYDDALNSMIDDTLKLGETQKFKITVSNSDIGQQLSIEANQMHMAPSALMAALQHAGVSEQHIKDHFSADLQFILLVQAYNKGVDPSEEAIRSELAKNGGKSAAGIDYKLHQIIFTLHGKNIFAEAQDRMKVAEQLRARFVGCADGLPLARNMDDVAVKDEIIRNSLQIGDDLKDLLDKTPVGHLTPPERTADGVAMIAVCSKGISTDDTAIRKSISERLLSTKIAADAARRLVELRSYAVIVKH